MVLISSRDGFSLTSCRDEWAGRMPTSRIRATPCRSASSAFPSRTRTPSSWLGALAHHSYHSEHKDFWVPFRRIRVSLYLGSLRFYYLTNITLPRCVRSQRRDHFPGDHWSTYSSSFRRETQPRISAADESTRRSDREPCAANEHDNPTWSSSTQRCTSRSTLDHSYFALTSATHSERFHRFAQQQNFALVSRGLALSILAFDDSPAKSA